MNTSWHRRAKSSAKLVRRQHKLICAALQAPLALQRKSSANQRANHFPKDVRCVRNDAQTILAAGQSILASGANHFASTRKPFCLEAQVIFWTVARPKMACAEAAGANQILGWVRSPPRTFERRSQIL
jgi:hypothetical protein